MGECIMVGCDLHDRSLLLKGSLGRGRVRQRTFRGGAAGREEMIGWLRQWASRSGATRIVFGYEASGQGFGLYDALTASGMECVVVAPTRMARSVKQVRTKTDAKDADALLELVRGHVLAGNALPSVWIPDAQTRDDREVVRTRINVASKIGSVKTQIQALLKRHGVGKPSEMGASWTAPHRRWLDHLVGGGEELASGGRVALGTLWRQLGWLEAERTHLDEAVKGLSVTGRYAAASSALAAQSGVGTLTAMVFLTELGDLSRLSYRTKVGADLGLSPCCWESGEASDRKGRITRQGPWRVRRVLCQAAHAWLRTASLERELYQRLVEQNPRKKKKAVVATMRRLAIRLWHIGLAAQQEAGVFSDCEAAA